MKLFLSIKHLISNEIYYPFISHRRLKSILGPFDLYGSTIQDPLLRSRRELVCQIFQLVDSPENLEISVAALRAIQDMAESPVFASSAALGSHQPSSYSPHKLFSILETAGMLESVRQAYVRRLEREEPEAHNNTSSSVHDFGLTNFIRLQILDFLLKHGTRFGSGYNLAHYLLGFPIPGTFVGSDEIFGDPKKPGVPPTCLHIVSELLEWGLGQPSSPIVMVEHPSLGVRLYQLIALLCENPASRGPVRSFLKDWSLRQVKNVSSELLDPKDPNFTVHDLMQRGWLFAAVASDLHEAISVGREYSYAERLVTALIKNGDLDGNGKLERPKIAALLQGLSTSLDIISQVSREKVELIEDLSAAFCHAITSLFRIVDLVLFASREAHLQLAEMVENSGICASLYALLSQCINSTCLPVGALERISSTVLAITNFQLRLGKASFIDLEDHISILLRICLRQDGSTIARGYVYAALVATTNSRPSSGFKAGNNSSPFAVIANSVKEVLSRFLLVVCADATAAISQDFEAWSTLAFSALAAVINLFSRQSMLMLVLEELGQSGFLKTLLLSLGPNESRLATIVQPTSDLASSNLNPLLLWKAKFALLEQLCLRPEGMNKMVELDLIEHLQALRVLTWKGGDSLGMQTNLGIFLQARLEEIIEPVLRLLALILVGGSADGENGGLMVKKRIRMLLGTHQEPILDLLRLRGPLEAKAEEFMQQASNLALIRHVLVLLNGTASEEDTPLLIPVARSLCANILIKCLGVLEQTILGEHAPVMILKVLAEVLSFQRLRTMAMVASFADQPDLPVSLPYSPAHGIPAEMAQTGQLSISILERLMIVVVKHIRAESDRLVSSRSSPSGAADSSVPSISILLFIWDMLLYLAWTQLEYRHCGALKEDAEAIRSLCHAFIPAIDSFCEIPNISTDSYGPSVPMRPLTIQRWIRQLRQGCSQ